MEASVAIVQLRQSAWSDRMNSSPHDYDIIVLDEISRPSTSYAKPRGQEGQYVNSRTTVGSHTVGKTVVSLPKFRIENEQLSLSDAVLEALANKTKVQYRRAVVVPLFDDRPNSTSKGQVIPGTALICAPALMQDKIQYPYGRLENLARLVNMCHNSPETMEVQTRHMLLRLDEWIGQSQCMNPHFLASLFVRPASSQRVLRCSHNPAYVGDEHDKCLRYIQKNLGSTKSIGSSVDLDEKVRIGNLVRVQMMTYNKCNTFVLNPLFCWLPYGKTEVPEYFAASKKFRKKSSASPSLHEFSGRFPLHRAAYIGDDQAIETLLARGHPVNELDNYSWTALHYACFYGHSSVVNILLTEGKADVNSQNKGLATPLHFAAMSGNARLVELMLSHAKINKDLKNIDGRSALDLCESVPKQQWQEVAKLLRDWKEIEKIQVDFIEAGSVMVLSDNRDETTADQIIAQLTKEVKISASAAKIFGLWVCSESLALQLKGNHKISQHLNVQKWRQNVAKWTGREDSKETPHLVFKRNAHATLEMEERLEVQASKHEFAISLLFDEARFHFLNGHYPCDEKQTILLAKLIAKILYGKGSTLSENSDLTLILPASLANDRSVDWRKKINKALKEPFTENVALLQSIFLQQCRHFRIYGSTFFEAEVYLARPHDQKRILCGINDYGFHIIELPSHRLLVNYEYKGLSWQLSRDKDFLEMRHRAHDHRLAIKTPQAAQIDLLMKKITGI